MNIQESIQTIQVVAIAPNIRQGRPYIIGTSVTVADVAIAKNYHRQDADGIADWYGLTLSQVYGALAYYYQYKSEIDQTIRTQLKRAESFKEQRVGSRDSFLS